MKAEKKVVHSNPSLKLSIQFTSTLFQNTFIQGIIEGLKWKILTYTHMHTTAHIPK
jgi:hypothetical protein